MSVDPIILRAMQAAGCTMDQIISVVETEDAARRERQRTSNRERQRRYKERHNENNADNALPTLDGVTERDGPPKEYIKPPVLPSQAKACSGVVKARRGARISTDWQPERPMPKDVAGLVAQWPPGRLDRELHGFRDYWLARSRDAARTDWDRTWWNRIRDQHDKVMRATNGHSDRSIRGTGTDEYLAKLDAARRDEAAERASGGQAHDLGAGAQISTH